MHYAVHGNTAAEVIVARADHTKEHMGLTSWRNAPDGKIVKADVSIAKNYLSKGEIQELNEIVTMYLDYATRQARRHIPMTMADWASKLDAFLQFNDAEVLQNKGKVTAAIAKPLRKVNLSSTVSFKIVCIKVILTVLLPAQKKKTTNNRKSRYQPYHSR